MFIDFRAPGAWSNLNDFVAERLGIDLDKNSVRVYQGAGHAVVEVALGLAKLLLNRKKIYYFKNMDPTFEPAIIALAKEGYQVTALELDKLSDPQSFVAGFGREELFILYSCDEPLLGRAYDVSALELALQTANIFKIRVSHARHFTDSSVVPQASVASPSVVPQQQATAQPIIIDRNSALIYALRPTQAIALLGERAKIAALTSDQVVHDCKFELGWFKEKSPASHRELILNFENKQIADSKPYFSATDLRVYDRAAIYWLDIDGHAVIDRLAKKLGFQLQAPGFEDRLETTSLSRWGGVRTLDFYKNQPHATQKAELVPNMMRGLVLISAKLLAEVPDLEKHLVEVRASILKDQNAS